MAAWSITVVRAGVLVFASAASAKSIPSVPRFILCGLRDVALLPGLTVLTWIDQDDARLTFGETGGFLCPFVPFLPVACILVKSRLLVYVLYGRKHSLLVDAVYMPIELQHEHEIHDIIS